MHFVIMGCGRVGASISLSLVERGHSVAVIDRDPKAFRRLGATFTGITVTGVGFDRDVLRQADVEQAYAFAAVSSGDNSNILAARTAREQFGVQNVVARIYDSQRAEVFQRMGIPTVATVRWTADQMMRRILPAGTAPHFTDNSGLVQLAETTLSAAWVGHPVRRVQEVSGARVAFVSRMGEGMLPEPDTKLQDGDVLFLMMHTADEAAVDRALSAGPGETE